MMPPLPLHFKPGQQCSDRLHVPCSGTHPGGPGGGGGGGGTGRHCPCVVHTAWPAGQGVRLLHLALQMPLDAADQRQSLVNDGAAVGGAAHHFDTACSMVVDPIASTFQYDCVLVYAPQLCAAQPAPNAKFWRGVIARDASS